VLGAAVSLAPTAPGRFRISLDDFPVLNNEFTSIRLAVNPLLPGVGSYPDGNFYPILVNRGEGTQFYALDAECQHASCTVPIYEEAMGGIICPCHGSVYDIDGSVLETPATRPLRQYGVTFDGAKTLTVEVPGLGYEVTSRLVAGDRLRLEFPTHLNATYEVRFRPSFQFDTNWAAIPFATSPEGPANVTSLTGDGDPAAVFVERVSPAGFYAVSIVLLDLT
jgi:nitrite reductase/ring-hydroxylating ferredoxin subunit